MGRLNLLVQTQGSAVGDMTLNLYPLDELSGPGWGFLRQDLNDENDQASHSVRHTLYESPWKVHLKPQAQDEVTFINSFGPTVAVPTAVSPMPKSWAVTCEGMQPVYGTIADFGAAAEGFRMAAIKPVHGWGTRFEVTDKAGQPVEQAIVLVDGNPVGRTHADGGWTLLLSSRPKSVEIGKGELRWSWEPARLQALPWTAAVLR